MNPATSTTPQPNFNVGQVFEGGDFRDRFNRSSFQFKHTLGGSSLFELTRLVGLAETLLELQGPSSVAWTSSNAELSFRWSDMKKKDRRESLTAAIQNLETSGSWMLLYRVQADPVYRSLMNQVIAEVAQLSGEELERDITWRDAYIFLASPYSVTPYHIDHESTFLFQIHGRREANIWNREDPAVLPDTEKEAYYAGNLSAATYRQENQCKASVYDMVAGTGVHHPVLAPHAFKNGPTYSVALGVHFCLRTWDKHARVHQMNSCLRGLRLEPTPPGSSKSRDWLKIQALGLLSKRRPRNKNELLRSGFARLSLPFTLVSRLKKRFGVSPQRGTDLPRKAV